MIVNLSPLIFALVHLGIFGPHVSWVSVPNEAVCASGLSACVMMANGGHTRMSLVALDVVITDSHALWLLVAFNRVSTELSVLLKVN